MSKIRATITVEYGLDDTRIYEDLTIEDARAMDECLFNSGLFSIKDLMSKGYVSTWEVIEGD